MENKNTGIIVLLVLVIIGLVGYIIYDKAIKEEEKIEVKNENSEKVEKEENSLTDCIDMYVVEDRYYDEIDTTEEPFQMGMSSLVLDKMGQVLVSNYSNTTKGKELETKYGKNYVLIDNVSELYSFYYGNAGDKVIIVLKSDGTLSMITSNQISATNINWSNNVGNLKNITRVYKKPVYIETPAGKSINASSIVAVDKNGKEYELNNYIK